MTPQWAHVIIALTITTLVALYWALGNSLG